MLKQLKKVKEFHEAFQIVNNTRPVLLSPQEWELRLDLMREELTEYKDACTNVDLVGVLDSLVDQAYILYGTILRHGLQDVFEKAFDMVHENNMSKLGPDGKPIINGENGVLDPDKPIGKVLKPKDFKPVNLSILLNDNNSL